MRWDHAELLLSKSGDKSASDEDGVVVLDESKSESFESNSTNENSVTTSDVQTVKGGSKRVQTPSDDDNDSSDEQQEEEQKLKPKVSKLLIFY